MGSIKTILLESLPCWYELSFRKIKPAIILRVHRDFIREVEIFKREHPVISGFMKNFGFESFVDSFDRNFGFDNAFIRQENDGGKKDFVEFVAEIPLLRREIKCESCGGSGKDDFGKECPFCRDNPGIDYTYDEKTAYAISASFSVFFMISSYFQGKTSSSSFQLFMILTSADKRPCGCPLWGCFSIPLCFWLEEAEKRGVGEISEIVEAMLLTHKAMESELRPFTRHDFRSYLHDGGRLTLDCSGSRSAIYNESVTRCEGVGREFSSHDVDTPFQQLILLAGLAALHDRVRKEM